MRTMVIQRVPCLQPTLKGHLPWIRDAISCQPWELSSQVQTVFSDPQLLLNHPSYLPCLQPWSRHRMGKIKYQPDE